MCGHAHAQFQGIIDSDWLNRCVLEARVEVARVTVEMNPAAVCQCLAFNTTAVTK